MKKTLPLLLLTGLVLSLTLSSCGTKPAETVPADTTTSQDTPTVDNATAPDENQTTEWTSVKAEWVAVGEQTNLAPSDTPRAIAEGGLYLPYTPTALAQASNNIVLFFYAGWSPIGIATNKDIMEKKDKLPKDLTILQVNFDDADAMKQQYGVTDQQTFVQVTNTGELIKKWRGANTLEDIVQQIQK